MCNIGFGVGIDMLETQMASHFTGTNFGVDNVLGKIRTTEDDHVLSEQSFASEFLSGRFVVFIVAL